jgi:hypothetical protein
MSIVEMKLLGAFRVYVASVKEKTPLRNARIRSERTSIRIYRPDQEAFLHFNGYLTHHRFRIVNNAYF